MKTVNRCFAALLVLVLSVPAAAQGLQRDLTLTAGLGTGCYAEMGSSPVTYSGAAFMLAAGVETDHGRIATDWDVAVRMGTYMSRACSNNVSSFIQPSAHVDVLCLLNPDDVCAVRAGVTVSDHVCVIQNEALMNASLSLSNFLSMGMSARATMPLPPLPWNGHRWMADAALTVSPWALVSRPGYSYVPNSTASDDIVGKFLDGYSTRSCFLAETHCRLRMARLLNNGNRIAIGYDWQSLDTHRSSIHRYAEADHALTLTLYFNLRRP